MFDVAIARSIRASNVDGEYIPIEVHSRFSDFVRRKLKCDKGSPCANCTKISRPCIFIASSLDADAQKRLAEVKEKMGVLERSLEEDVARHGRPKAKNLLDTNVPIRLPGQEESHSDQEDDEDTKQLNISSFVTEDAAYYDDEANLDDEILDLGISIGKMRVTERIGGLVRPRFAEEVGFVRSVLTYWNVDNCSLLKRLEHYHQVNM